MHKNTTATPSVANKQGAESELARIVAIAAADPESKLSRSALNAIYDGVSASDFSAQLRAEAAKMNRGIAFTEKRAGNLGGEPVDPANRGASYAAKKAAKRS